jgi:hypothetical protein
LGERRQWETDAKLASRLIRSLSEIAKKEIERKERKMVFDQSVKVEPTNL